MKSTPAQKIGGSEAASSVNRALKIYQVAIERSGGRAAWAWCGLGTLQMSLATAKSLTTLDAIEKSDFDVSIDGAIESFQSLLRIKPEDLDGWMRLGQAYASASRYTAALKSFKTVLKLDPGSSPPEFHRGR